MSATSLDITIEQGADFEQDFSVLNGGISTQDLHGASAAMQVRADFGYPSPLVTLTTANGGLTIDAESRTISAFIDNLVTAAMTGGFYVYDLKLLTRPGTTYRTHQGSAMVSPEVTVIEPPPAIIDSISMENGGSILLEDGSKIEVETPTAVDVIGLEGGGAVAQEDGSNISIEG